MSDPQKYPLNSLGLQIKDHWLKYRPQMCEDLKSRGLLEKSVHLAQEKTS